MKNILKIMTLLFSFSLVAENAVESATIAPISHEHSINVPQEAGDKDKSESKIEKGIDFFDIFAKGAITIGALQLLDLMSLTAHEYGHALPSAVTGRNFSVNITRTGDPIFPFTGFCGLEGSPSLLTLVLGPIAGISTTYLQCVAIKAWHDHDHDTQNRSFSEHFKLALKYPITFFTNAMNASEKRCSSWLNKKPLPPSNQEKATPGSFMVNTIIFFRTMHMIAESIYGFLPYDTGNDRKSDGESIWHTLLGKQPSTFKIDLGVAAVGIMATPMAIGAMKAIYKKVYEKNDNLEAKDSFQTDDASFSNINIEKNTP